MARNRAALGKHHGPWQRRHPAEQFAIDEVSDAAETQPYRNHGADEIRDLPEIPFSPFRDVPRREYDPNESSME